MFRVPGHGLKGGVPKGNMEILLAFVGLNTQGTVAFHGVDGIAKQIDTNLSQYVQIGQGHGRSGPRFHFTPDPSALHFGGKQINAVENYGAEEEFSGADFHRLQVVPDSIQHFLQTTGFPQNDVALG